MGKWHNEAIPLYGYDFQKKMFTFSKSTRAYEEISTISVNLYDSDKDALFDCYERETRVGLGAYCRDYIDLAILHSEGSANMIHHLGDGLPSAVPYPVFNKVRPLCHNLTDSDFINNLCSRKKRASVIVLPLNRHRHFSKPTHVPESDIPWEKKIRRAVWRSGSCGEFHPTLSDTNDIKHALVSRYLNSSLVDAKCSKLTKNMPEEFVGSYMDMRDQLTHKYIISIEGNDVSSGLKWMLFSNSVVLAPSFTWESWAMEGKLEPFIHYIPLKADMSNVEHMVQWAEENPETTQMIAQRSTLYIYDMLFHPDALKDERDVMAGMMERYEINFGFQLLVQNVHPKPIDWLTQPEDLSTRASRFPSVEERVKYYMGDWFQNNEDLAMRRSEYASVFTLVKENAISKDRVFIAEGYNLSQCTDPKHMYLEEVRLFCLDSLPHFDERNTFDLKSIQFEQIRKSNTGKSMKLAARSFWSGHKTRYNKESKRVLIDDSIKILYFGDQLVGGPKLPVFAKTRCNSEEKYNTIIWPFGFERDLEEIVNLGLIESVDREFRNKHVRAIWRGDTGTNQERSKESLEYQSRLALVRRSIDSNSELIDAKFNIPGPHPFWSNSSELFSDFEAVPFPETSEALSRYIKGVLTYRYLVATEGNIGTNHDLKWMLLSQSIVLMPIKRRTISWFMEHLLEPYVHFIPIADDYSDIEEKVQWCEDHLSEVQTISKRATLFVHDMLFDKMSEKDDTEVRFRIMERYAMLYG